MAMTIGVLGPKLFERDEHGQLKSRVGTIFPRQQMLVTVPGIHAWQRAALVDYLNQQRAAQGQPPLNAAEEQRECATSVDLFFEPDLIIIRPDPEHMKLAFEADEALQGLISKRQIRFMFVFNERVQRAIKERGESWRISPLPRSTEEMQRLIQDAHAAIRERPIYYYSRAGGTRYLSYQEFAQLEPLEAASLARQLDEISVHSRCRNRLGNPEVDFFKADPLRFSARDFAGIRFGQLAELDLRAQYRQLKSHFEAAVTVAYREDNLQVAEWCNAMFAALVWQKDETIAAEILRGLSPDFFLKIEWLPGGRFEEGEFILDTIFDEAEQKPEDAELKRLCDVKAKGFIFNFIREYGDLEYVNVGRIPGSLSRRPLRQGRRGVYMTELKARQESAPIVRFLRMQKWDVWERLDEGKPLLQALLETEEYTAYILDRRLGCRQLGMNLIPRSTMRRVSEAYDGTNRSYAGQMIPATYFERDYLYGTPTDKLPSWKSQNESYALRVAWLLGKAAASNLIIGRTYENGARVIFDDGDEVIVEDAGGMPADLIVSDHSGAFDEYELPLVDFAKNYARPVNSRLAILSQPREFAEVYMNAFLDQFLHVQGDYRKRRRAFNTLFKHCRYDPAGSFAYRWECVLKRLDATDAPALANAIRQQITSLAENPSP